jgi:hypothetical protein
VQSAQLEIKDPKEQLDCKETVVSLDSKAFRDQRVIKGYKDCKASKVTLVRKEHKVLREPKEFRVPKVQLVCKEYRVFKEPRETKEQRESKASKVFRAFRVSKEQRVLKVLPDRKEIWVQLDCRAQQVWQEKRRTREQPEQLDLQESKESKECLVLRH